MPLPAFDSHLTTLQSSLIPLLGIPSPVREIASDGYDTDQITLRARNRKLSKGLYQWSDFLQQVLIRKTHKDRIWDILLVDLPVGGLKRICLRFCDTEGTVRYNYDKLMADALQCMQQQWQDLVGSHTCSTKNLAINFYRCYCIAVSVPVPCSIHLF